MQTKLLSWYNTVFLFLSQNSIYDFTALRNAYLQRKYFRFQEHKFLGTGVYYVERRRCITKKCSWGDRIVILQLPCNLLCAVMSYKNCSDGWFTHYKMMVQTRNNLGAYKIRVETLISYQSIYTSVLPANLTLFLIKIIRHIITKVHKIYLVRFVAYYWLSIKCQKNKITASCWHIYTSLPCEK